MKENEVRVRTLFKRLYQLAKTSNPILEAMERMAHKGTQEVVQKPFAGFTNWDACMEEQLKQYDKETAEKVCGKLKSEYEGKRASCSCRTMTGAAVKRLLAEGVVLKYRDGSVVCDVAKQGGRAMARVATPQVLLWKAKALVDALLTKRGRNGSISDGEVETICKQVIGQIPPGWEGYTIPDWTSYASDAKQFLTKLGYSSGVGDLTPDVNVISTASSREGGSPSQSFTDTFGVSGPAGQGFVKSRYGRRLLALKQALKKDGLYAEDDIPMEKAVSTLTKQPENVEEHTLNLEERVAACEAGLDEMSKFVSTLAATAGKEAEAADQAGSAIAGEPEPKKEARVGKSLDTKEMLLKRRGLIRVEPRSAVSKAAGGNGRGQTAYRTILGG